MELFSHRLGQLLAGRKIHPWGAALGVSKGAAETMSKGQVPGAEILRLIRYQEGVSLGWLVTGDGAPFVLEHCDDPRTLAQALADEAEQGPLTLHLFGAGREQVLLLTRPGQLQYRQRRQAYRHVRLWTLALPALPPLLQVQCAEHRWLWHDCDAAQLSQLKAGELGPWLLLDSGQLPSAVPLADPLTQLQQALQTGAQGQISTALMRAVIQLVDDTAQEQQLVLDVGQRARVYTAVYRHAQRLQLEADALSGDQLQTLFEVVL